MIINHYGHTVDSEIPVTGVRSSNSVMWEFMDESICLTCESAREEIESDESMDDESRDDALEFMECDSSHTRLIGDWTLIDGQYHPDHSGEFAALENESTIQIVWSRTVRENRNLCSPCYPGQVDVESAGRFRGYDVPDELIYDPSAVESIDS